MSSLAPSLLFFLLLSSQFAITFLTYFLLYQFSFPTLTSIAQKSIRWRDAVRHLVAALEKGANVVRECREDVEFGPSDTSDVDAFLFDEKATAARRAALERRRRSVAQMMSAKEAAESGYERAKSRVPALPRMQDNDEEDSDLDDDEELEEDGFVHGHVMLLIMAPPATGAA